MINPSSSYSIKKKQLFQLANHHLSEIIQLYNNHITLLLIYRIFSCWNRSTRQKQTKSHESIDFIPQRKVARVAISNHSQKQLKQIFHSKFPSLGKSFEEIQSAVVIESVKIAADVYISVSGKVVNFNSKVEETLLWLTKMPSIPSYSKLNEKNLPNSLKPRITRNQWLIIFQYYSPSLSLFIELNFRSDNVKHVNILIQY